VFYESFVFRRYQVTLDGNEMVSGVNKMSVFLKVNHYNQGKTTHEIAKIERASICDISAIFLNIILHGKILKLLTLIL
jgi:hypothetical protein